MELIQGAPASTVEERKTVAAINKTVEAVRRFLAEPAQPLKVGDVVRWKAAMCNRRLMPDGSDVPMVIVELLHTPHYDQHAPSGSVFFKEPLDTAIGWVDKDGDFNVIYVDSRRLELLP